MLQRIYGTAWESPEQLKAYQHLKAEAARRDHRKLGQELDLFSIQESAGGWRAAVQGCAARAVCPQEGGACCCRPAGPARALAQLPVLRSRLGAGTGQR
jgi:hypothetical protein